VLRRQAIHDPRIPILQHRRQMVKQHHGNAALLTHFSEHEVRNRSHRPIWSPHFQRPCSSLFSRLILRLDQGPGLMRCPASATRLPSLSSREDAVHLRHDDRHLNIKRIVPDVKTTRCEMNRHGSHLSRHNSPRLQLADQPAHRRKHCFEGLTKMKRKVCKEAYVRSRERWT